MCSRFLADCDVHEQARRFQVRSTLAIWHAQEPCIPTGPVLSIIQDQTRRLGSMCWGWPRVIEGSQRLLLHSRAESVSRRATFSEAFQRRRCVVLLTAWMEPQRGANGKPRPGRWPPWVVIPADGEAMAVAALWECVDGGRVVLMTTAACPLIAHISDRMPALLLGDHVDQWLDPATPAKRLHALLGPSQPPLMGATQAQGKPG